MSANKTPTLIFEQWAAKLKSKQKTRLTMGELSEELFESLKTNGTSFDEAHEMISKAHKALMPPTTLMKRIYQTSNYRGNSTEKEFMDDWLDDIKKSVTESFFSIYPVKTVADDEDDAPKVYGSMSAKEYKLQRTYADSFPTLNTDELERQLQERRQRKTLSFEDLKNVLEGKIDGK